jgi:glutamate racemase
MLAAGVDTLVLGCTHYPFVQPLLAQIVATETTTAVSIIDPAPAVARQVERRLHKLNLLAETAVTSTVPGAEPGTIVYTTGDAPRLQALAHTLLGQELVTKTAVWRGDTLHLPE